MLLFFYIDGNEIQMTLKFTETSEIRSNCTRKKKHIHTQKLTKLNFGCDWWSHTMQTLCCDTQFQFIIWMAKTLHRFCIAHANQFLHSHIWELIYSVNEVLLLGLFFLYLSKVMTLRASDIKRNRRFAEQKKRDVSFLFTKELSQVTRTSNKMKWKECATMCCR